MDVKAAAILVLQQAGRALHAKDIAEKIMAAGLLRSEGKTPDATASARLYSDIKSNGDKSTIFVICVVLLALDHLPILTEPMVALKRIVILAFPASMGAVVVDSFDKE